jgi:hypothetical protein
VSPELFVAGVVALRRHRELLAFQFEQQRLDQLGPAMTGLPHDFPKRG